MDSLLVFANLEKMDVPLWLTLPFAGLLLLIAVMPLTPERVKHLWEKYYAHAAIGLGLVVVAYYLFLIPAGGSTVVHTLQEYFSFICLIGSLFVVAGGIHLKVKGSATPLGNVTFLAVAAVCANLIGTTGASMVFIRPFIRMNKIRISAYHVVFFIFIVSNCGGALTPIGDPPLFLGYLKGVPFFWLVDKVLLQWLFTLAAVLAVFYLFDRKEYAKVVPSLQHKIEEPDEWRFDGAINVLLLVVIIGAVFLPDAYFVREIVMLAAAVLSYKFTPKHIHTENNFNFGPIKEVAFLFVGIFMTMMPALGYIDAHGKDFGVKKPMQYYVASGSLSSVLDNAPTYATFARLAQSTAQADNPDNPALHSSNEIEVMRAVIADGSAFRFIVAVSLGSVFFGAMTYIGNGPNFMVKSIAESTGVKVPTFFGYIVKYSVPILLPILLISGFIFL